MKLQTIERLQKDLLRLILKIAGQGRIQQAAGVRLAAVVYLKCFIWQSPATGSEYSYQKREVIVLYKPESRQGTLT